MTDLSKLNLRLPSPEQLQLTYQVDLSNLHNSQNFSLKTYLSDTLRPALPQKSAKLPKKKVTSARNSPVLLRNPKTARRKTLKSKRSYEQVKGLLDTCNRSLLANLQKLGSIDSSLKKLEGNLYRF